MPMVGWARATRSVSSAPTPRGSATCCVRVPARADSTEALLAELGVPAAERAALREAEVVG